MSNEQNKLKETLAVQQEMVKPDSFTQEMKKLGISTRQKVRAILTAQETEALTLFNQLRETRSASEIAQIETILRANPRGTGSLVPELFPTEPQTSENYYRTYVLPLSKQVEVLALLFKQHRQQLQSYFSAIATLNAAIVKSNLAEASNLIREITRTYGHSHLILRKAALIKNLSTATSDIEDIEKLLKLAGLETNKVAVTSLLNCYKGEHDHLNLKRSIMHLTKRGRANKFTRDIARIAFHPFAKNEDDLAEILHSALQSSLADAFLTINVNKHIMTKFCANSSLTEIFQLVGQSSPNIDEIARQYPDDDAESEHLFYKHSSAWLECENVVQYRMLQDHFYDHPESEYFEIGAGIVSAIDQWVWKIEPNDMATACDLTKHKFSVLKRLESRGMVTRSSIFNYYVHVVEGYAEIEEAALMSLMGVTRDLSKTINPKYLTTTAKFANSQITQLVLYLLIAKKSKNEQDDHHLRRVFQDLVRTRYKTDIVAMFEALNEMSAAVATYAYEVCTEDFIAKLFHLISSSSEITETRANLHKWRGKITGEQAYLDRARTLLIDHQLNKIRNEIDDNRIYVDSARFTEWFYDEAFRELDTILAAMEHKNELLSVEDPELIAFVEQCYVLFCSNNIFGIASYLGRRIRHGTFKGHLYSGVISIERQPKFRSLFSDPAFMARWSQWKFAYELKIVGIIQDRLHIESPTKKDGLLKPGQNRPGKQETIAACAKAIVRDFSETGVAHGAVSLIIEYCWRLAEGDLKVINTYLKNKKVDLINNDQLIEMRLAVHDSPISKEFSRDLIRLIDEKLMSMYNWFKRPINVSPKASLALLYKAVAAEVKDTFPDFETETDYDENDEIELVGGIYHILYDSFYVVVYNAAKHGKPSAKIRRRFGIMQNTSGSGILLTISITSPIRDEDTDEIVNERLTVHPGDDITNAQSSEERSGLRKLHQLQQNDSNFVVDTIKCINREVVVHLTYALEH